MISLLIMIALIGFGAYVLIRFVPMPQAARTALIVVAVFGIILYALHAFGIHIPEVPVPQVH